MLENDLQVANSVRKCPKRTEKYYFLNFYRQDSCDLYKFMSNVLFSTYSTVAVQYFDSLCILLYHASILRDLLCRCVVHKQTHSYITWKYSAVQLFNFQPVIVRRWHPIQSWLPLHLLYSTVFKFSAFSSGSLKDNVQ